MPNSDKLQVSAWISAMNYGELKRLQDQAKHVRAAFPAIGQEPKWMAAGQLCKDHGIAVWPVLDIAANNELVQAGLVDASFLEGLQGSLQGMIKDGEAKGLCLNLSKIEDLKGMEAGLKNFAQSFAAKKLPLIFTLRPSALDPAEGAELAKLCERLQLCLAVAPAGAGAILGTQGFKDSLGPWLTKVPAEKIEVVLPGHGWSRTKDLGAQPLPWDLWTALVAEHGPERRDPETNELFLTSAGGSARIIDSIGYSAKLWQLRELGLTQFCFSGLGQEDPRLWALIDTLPVPFKAN